MSGATAAETLLVHRLPNNVHLKVVVACPTLSEQQERRCLPPYPPKSCVIECFRIEKHESLRRGVAAASKFACLGMPEDERKNQEVR